MPRLRPCHLACLGLLWLLSGCSSLSFAVVNLPTHFAEVRRDTDLAFGPEARQRLDVYRPPASSPGSHPVIVFCYGGTWTSGSREHYRFVGTTLAKHGYVVVIPDYRLYPAVRFPAFVEDFALAVAWTQRHIDQYGGDSHRIVLMGHSAGAQMAALVALDPQYLVKAGADPTRIAGLIGLSGPYELTPNSTVLNTIFAAPYGPQDWQPIRHVSPRAPPTLLIHGSHDRIVWLSNSQHMASALRAAGASVQLHVYPGRGHATTVGALSWVLRARAPTLQDIDAFMRQLPPSAAAR